MTPYKWFDLWHLDLIIFANHITRQISIQMTMTLRANIRPVINDLIWVVMQGTAMAFVPGLCTARFGMLPAGFPVS